MSTIRRTAWSPYCLFAATLGLAASGSPAQEASVVTPSTVPSSIFLRSRVIDPQGAMPDAIGEGEFGRVHILASFDKAITRQQILDLNRNFDIQVLDRCPVNAHVLSVPQRLLQGVALLRSLPPGTRVAPLQPTDKMSPRLLSRGARFPPTVPPYTSRRDALVEAIVLFHGDHRDEDLQARVLSQQRARPLQRLSAINGWRIALPEEQIARLAARDSVKWIEEGPPPPHDDNNELRGADGVNADAVQTATTSPEGAYGLSGQGVVIAQWETSNASIAHEDLAPRVTLGDLGVPPDSRFYRYADVAADQQYNGGEPFYLDTDDSLTVTPGDWRAANVGALTPGTVKPGDADVAGPPTRLRELRYWGLPFEAFLDSAQAPNGLYDPGEAIYTDKNDDKRGKVSEGDIRRTSVARNDPTLAPYPVGSAVYSGDDDIDGLLKTYPYELRGSPHHHATHVAGTMMGAGDDNRGVAPKARLISYHVKRLDVGADVSKLPDEHARAIAAGATIANNSWGVQDYYCSLNDSGYGAQSALSDALASGYDSDGTPRTQRRMLLVFSAGNAYGLDCAPSGLPPPAESVVPPEWGTVQATNSAKNVLTVANAAPGNESAGVPTVLSDDSLRGPTGQPVTPLQDGRLKPDISAPGRERLLYHGVISTIPPRDLALQGSYAGDGGTSMAAPAVSGSAALLTEWYRRECDAAGPMPDLLRATLVHTARDIQKFLKTDAMVDPRPFRGPDYGSGYGMVDVANAVKVMMHHRRGALSDTSPIEYPLSVGAVPQLKVTLAWDDPPYPCPCAVSATHGLLQNDLDVVLVDPLGNKHAPWQLDPGNPGVEAQPSGPIAGDITTYLDHRNTIEQIVVKDPIPGAWTIRVSASQMNPVFEEQSFAIVSELLSPVHGDPAYCP